MRPSLPHFNPPDLSAAYPYVISYVIGPVGFMVWQKSDSPPAAGFMEAMIAWTAVFAGFVFWRLLRPSTIRDMWLFFVSLMAQTAAMLYLTRVYPGSELFKPAAISMLATWVVTAFWIYLGHRTVRPAKRSVQPAPPVRAVGQQPQGIQRPQGLPSQQGMPQGIPRPQTQAS